MEQKNSRKKLLLVANVAKEHVIKFHIPTIKLLTERGWTVDVACSGEDPVPYCHKQYRLSYERASLNGNLLKGIRELETIIDSGNYDLVYCHTTIGGVAGRIASKRARKKGTKVIYLSHGYFFYKGCPAIYWPTFFLTEKILSYFTDAIITINDEDYEISKKEFDSCRIYRIDGIGVDFSRIEVPDPDAERERIRSELAIPEDATVLIYLAELHGNKNQRFLIDVMEKLIAADETVYLILAGYDHAQGEYQRVAVEKGLEDRIKFLGWRDDIGSLYAAADICTATSIREGFGLNLVEAMACGVPVVASKNRGHSTIVRDGENGFLIEQGDIDRFANCVKTLIHDPSIRQRFIDKGFLTKQKYSSLTVTEKLYEILTEVSES